MRKMRAVYPLLALVAILVTGACVQAQNAATITAEGPRAGLMGGGLVVTAKVISVDRKTRVVTMVAEDGEQIDIVAGPEVKNLDQVEKGDTVEVEYFEALALALTEQKTGIQERVDTVSATEAPKGEKPAASAMHRISAIATVMDIDKEQRLVVLKGPTQVVTVKVGDAVDLTSIDIGDEVKAEYVEEMAISVKEPE